MEIGFKLMGFNCKQKALLSLLLSILIVVGSIMPISSVFFVKSNAQSIFDSQKSIDEEIVTSEDDKKVFSFDVDGDGTISAADARRLLRIAVGLETVKDYASLSNLSDDDINSEVARHALRIAVKLEINESYPLISNYNKNQKDINLFGYILCKNDYVNVVFICNEETEIYSCDFVLNYNSPYECIDVSFNSLNSWDPKTAYNYNESNIVKIAMCYSESKRYNKGEVLFTCRFKTNDAEDYNFSLEGSCKTIEQQGCFHNNYSLEMVSPSTCTEYGALKYTCQNCDFSYMVDTGPNGHSAMSLEIVSPSTCTEYGALKYKCQNCDYSYIEYTRPNGHSATWIEGYDGYCKTCGEINFELYGDVDFNLTVNAADMRLILRYLVGLTQFSTAQLKAADIRVTNAEKTIVDSFDLQYFYDKIYKTGANHFVTPMDVIPINDISGTSESGFSIDVQEDDSNYYISLVGKNIYAMTSFDTVIEYNSASLTYKSTSVNPEVMNINMSGLYGIAYNSDKNGTYKISAAFMGDGFLDDEVEICTLKFAKNTDAVITKDEVSVNYKMYFGSDYIVDVIGNAVDIPEETTTEPEETTAEPEETTTEPEETTTEPEETTTEPEETTAEPEEITTEPEETTAALIATTVAHIHSYTIVSFIEPSCFDNGTYTYSCECGENYTDTVYSTGHIDSDKNNKCDVCEELLTESQTKKSIFTRILDFYKKILDFFKNLFKK